MNQEGVVATSKSKHVLDAFYKHLLDQGFQEDYKWNKEYNIDYIFQKKYTPYLHIRPKTKNLEFHIQDCGTSIVYNLPEQWNEAIEAFTKVKNNKTVSEELIKKSGLKIGDIGIFAGLDYHYGGWTKDTWGSGKDFFDTDSKYRLIAFEVYTDCVGTSKDCAVATRNGDGDGKFYFPLEQFIETIQFKNYRSKVKGNTIAFGCQKFTKEELLAYKKLLNKEIGATIKIGNKEVTVEILDELIKKLKNK